MESRTSVIAQRLQPVKRIIAVASGKGGVGKSLVASGLALYLTKKGYTVGLLDLDLSGPSSHIILGANIENFPEEDKGIIPPKVEGIRFLSIVYYTKDKAAPFRGGDVTNIIIELLAITQWGPLDYLIIDMPPGLGEETLDVLRFLPSCEFLVVTTPSQVALGPVRKLIQILVEMKKPVLGVVENMKMVPSSLVEKEAARLGVRYLGSISYDTGVEQAIGDPRLLKKTGFMKDLSDAIQKLNL
ncbi:MAG: ATP-binding protein [Methanobacteriota archaeon]